MDDLELKLRLLFLVKGDVNKAEQAYNFITKEESEKNPDGVYLILNSGEKQLFTINSNNKPCKNCVAIGIQMGSKSIAIALKDAAEGHRIPLTKTTKSIIQPFYYHYSNILAASDWESKENTNYLKQEGLVKEICLEENQRIPSTGEMYLILLNFGMLNIALEFVGGNPIEEDCYWSSTYHNSTNSYYMSFSSGNLYCGNRNTITNKVRLISNF